MCLAGCSVVRHPEIETMLRIKGIPGGFEKGQIVRPETGECISFEQLLSDLQGVRIVYIGEKHTNREHHDAQARIIEALHSKDPVLTIAMEMFESSDQQVLDRWTGGELDEQSFLSSAGWKEKWKYDFELYRGILGFIKDKSLALVGINVPNSIVEKVARTGLEGLSDEERALIAKEIDTSNELHKEYVRAYFFVHEFDKIEQFEFFYQAHCVWEDSMAEAVSRISDRGRLVVITGNGHIAHKFGVPDRVFRRTNAPFKTIMPIETGTRVKMGVADYIWVTSAQTPEYCGYGSGRRRKSLIGIKLQRPEGRNGVLILDVIPETPAARAGLKTRDIIVAVDGKPVSDPSDLHDAVAGDKGASSFLFKVDRQGEFIELNVRVERADTISP